MRPHSYRDDPAVPQFPDDRPVIVFDGLCALCSGSAAFVLRHDGNAAFRLLPAQSPLGHALYRHYGLDPRDYESMILIADGLAWLKSEAAIRIAQGLGFPWSFAAILRVVPLGWRDRFYMLIARNRIRWFGARTSCYRPDPRYADRMTGEAQRRKPAAVDNAGVLLLEQAAVRLSGPRPQERREPFKITIRIVV